MFDVLNLTGNYVMTCCQMILHYCFFHTCYIHGFVYSFWRGALLHGVLFSRTSSGVFVCRNISWMFFPCAQNICCISHVLGVYLLYFTKSKSNAYSTYVYILSGFERAKFKHNRKLTVSPLNIHTISLCSIFVTYTVQCHYNVVNPLTNIHKRRPIARPLGQGMGRLL